MEHVFLWVRGSPEPGDKADSEFAPRMNIFSFQQDERPQEPRRVSEEQASGPVSSVELPAGRPWPGTRPYLDSFTASGPLCYSVQYCAYAKTVVT